MLEFGFSIMLIISLVAFLVYFKRPIKRSVRYFDDICATNFTEGSADLIERSQNAYNEILTKCGKNYRTPQEVYDLVHRRHKDSEEK